MSLSAKVRHVAGVSVVELDGRVTLGRPEGETLRELLFREFDQGGHAVLLDCSRIEYVDSAGLGDLVAAYASIVRRGGALKLLRPNRRLEQLLALTHLDELFETHEDEATALASFTSASAAKTRAALADYLE